jgi:hypothetical protein
MTVSTIARLSGTFAQLHAAGCIQTGADVEWCVAVAAEKFAPLLNGLRILTDGRPCDGCPVFRGGECNAYQQYRESAVVMPKAATSYSNKYPGKSVRQIATELGVSIGEVRRRKLDGSI